MAIEHGEIVEVDLDDKEDIQPTAMLMSSSDIVLLCEKLEMACISQSHANTSLDLIQHIHKFHGKMHWEAL